MPETFLFVSTLRGISFSIRAMVSGDIHETAAQMVPTIM
jgi:hypothetical protein